MLSKKNCFYMAGSLTVQLEKISYSNFGIRWQLFWRNYAWPSRLNTKLKNLSTVFEALEFKVFECVHRISVNLVVRPSIHWSIYPSIGLSDRSSVTTLKIKTPTSERLFPSILYQNSFWLVKDPLIISNKFISPIDNFSITDRGGPNRIFHCKHPLKGLQ